MVAVAVEGGRPGESLPCSRRAEGLASNGRGKLRGVRCARQLGGKKEEMTQGLKMTSFLMLVEAEGYEERVILSTNDSKSIERSLPGRRRARCGAIFGTGRG